MAALGNLRQGMDSLIGIVTCKCLLNEVGSARAGRILQMARVVGTTVSAIAALGNLWQGMSQLDCEFDV